MPMFYLQKAEDSLSQSESSSSLISATPSIIKVLDTRKLQVSWLNRGRFRESIPNDPRDDGYLNDLIGLGLGLGIGPGNVFMSELLRGALR